jgi:23S rRNA (guanosine2251-2'-O)-methyltransferase
MPRLVLIAHNIRSAHNIGSLLRTAEGLGIEKVFLTGYSPYPIAKDDQRLPHIRQKIDKRINKTSLDAQHSIDWQHSNSLPAILKQLKKDGYDIAALEQTTDALDLSRFKPPAAVALIVGNEVEGIEPKVLAASDFKLMIPMAGKKESFNVAAAAAMALYQLDLADLDRTAA